MRATPERFRSVLLLGGAVIALAVAGCGGGDDSASTTAQATDGTTQSTGQGSGAGNDDTTGGSGGDTTGGSGGSTTIEPDVEPVDKIGIPKAPKGGDDSIQTFGEEADDQTSAEVVAGLRAYLDARAKGDWERACAFLVPGLTEQFNQLQQQQGGGEELSCADILKGLSAGLPKKVLEGAAEVNVGGVRVDGEQAFVVFKGDHNLWYAAPMGLVDGIWKSGSIAPSALP